MIPLENIEHYYHVITVVGKIKICLVLREGNQERTVLSSTTWRYKSSSSKRTVTSYDYENIFAGKIVPFNKVCPYVIINLPVWLPVTSLPTLQDKNCNWKQSVVSASKHVPWFTEALPVPVLLGLHLCHSRYSAFKRKDFFLGRENGAWMCIGLQIQKLRTGCI